MTENLETANLPMLAIGVALVVLSIAALVVLRRRRRVDEPEHVLDESHELAALADMVEFLRLNDETEGTESATVRALRAQVRSLEQALEVAPESAVPALVGAGAGAGTGYRHQVLLAVRAVAARTDEHDDPRHAAARVVAAVERLDVDGFTRPVLPGLASRPVAVAPPPPLPPSAPAAVEVTLKPELPSVEVRDEVVVPVPPPAPEQPHRRGRRRPRGTAA